MQTGNVVAGLHWYWTISTRRVTYKLEGWYIGGHFRACMVPVGFLCVFCFNLLLHCSLPLLFCPKLRMVSKDMRSAIPTTNNLCRCRQSWNRHAHCFIISTNKANNTAGLIAIRFFVAFSRLIHIAVSSLLLIYDPVVSFIKFLGFCA